MSYHSNHCRPTTPATSFIDFSHYGPLFTYLTPLGPGITNLALMPWSLLKLLNLRNLNPSYSALPIPFLPDDNKSSCLSIQVVDDLSACPSTPSLGGMSSLLEICDNKKDFQWQ